MKIRLLTPDDVTWPMGRQDSVPEYACGMGQYERQFKVDPFPCYAHDLDRVTTIAEMCEDIFPMPDARVGLFILSHDFIDRINGLAFEDHIYNREDGSEWDEVLPSYKGGTMNCDGQALSIVLSGKRIPLMPAMTRYLVSHEYGHLAFNYAARKLGYGEHEKDKLAADYMEVRKIEKVAKKYSGAQWHQSPQEIIANDFRVLFTKQELEYYPHECQLPSWAQPEGQWWKRACEACAVHLKQR